MLIHVILTQNPSISPFPYNLFTLDLLILIGTTYYLLVRPSLIDTNDSGLPTASDE
jgi:hypothetical protein|uniref:Uncharacterized protein n=1 Tax=Picea glauca TaxID=3330 RepID=A0A101M1N8_PICGL|nr:hypothetical protein ABT39_MTgene3955 [Picea glauca]